MVRAQTLGTVSGRVFDGETGVAIENATVILVFPTLPGAGDPKQDVATTGPAGDYEFDEVPSGSYTLNFVKSGYRVSTLTNFEVVAGEENVADFPMPPKVASADGEVLELDAFVVEAELAGVLMSNLDLRLESDQMVNLLSSEDFSKYAATDVAEALKRVAGVNIVGGQFAIIRGLDDRYTSTLYNGAPIPSPDPNRQSVQLDLFPSNIVGNLVVAKTYTSDLPSNSAGGSINIVTSEYAEDTTISLRVGAGFNERAMDRFLKFYAQNPVGVSKEPKSLIERDFQASISGREEFLGREFRFKIAGRRDLDYATKQGFQETREPDRGSRRRRRITETGDLALGILSLSRGRFELTQSEESKQHTAFVAAGVDLDREAHHKVDGSFLFIRKDNNTIQRRERGFIPNFDYSSLLSSDVTEVDASDFTEVLTQTGPLSNFRENPDPADGAVFYTVVDEHRAFTSKRELLVAQLNGEHDFTFVDGLSLDWAWNYAEANQEESSIRGVIFFEPDNPQAQVPSSVPTSVVDIGSGVYAINNRSLRFNANRINEVQHFARADLSYERNFMAELRGEFKVGVWYENAQRDVVARIALQPRLPGVSANSAIVGPSPLAIGGQVFDAAELGASENGLSGILASKSDLARKIGAISLNGKLTLWDNLDLQGGVRLEDLQITSTNDPFTGQVVAGSPQIFPFKYLFCDRLDNPALPSEGVSAVPTDVTFNDQIIGIDSPVDPQTGILDRISNRDIRQCINGEIHERMALPNAGITYRPSFRFGRIPGLGFMDAFKFDGLTLRAAYSQTVARPSFRELSYYVTASPGTDDYIIGNPQLGLSDVESWDLRGEFVWGDFSDLVAISLFKKKIKDPIEVIVIRDPSISDNSVPAKFRTFFNNPSGADLKGIEAEARLHLGMNGLFGRLSGYLDLVSVGGNYTYIDAKVERSQAEIDRTDPFFISDPADAVFPAYNRKRRLFGQPEWIANADITFDSEAWGTKVTLAYFSISEVLDAAGSVSLNANNEVTAFELDRYVDEFYQLDLVMSQEFELPHLPGGFKLRASIKNLTDTTRKIIYDQNQTTNDIRERSFKTGRDYSLSIKYTIEY